MKAISLWQPWASLIALGHKRYETRSWRTSYRGSLLIHAAKTFPPEARLFASEERALGRLPAQIPFGVIVATARLVACHRTEEAAWELSGLERRMGDYSAGRFAWELADVVALPEPIPCRGAQGLFEIDYQPKEASHE